MKKRTDEQLARILWDYHHLGQQPAKADCIIGLGSYDVRVAEYCAQLYMQEYAPFIVFSGNVGNFTRDLFNMPEAHVFRNIALKNGVPEKDILVEDKAMNTGENILLTKKLLAKKEIFVTSVIIVTKPNTERRAYATVKKVWPEINVFILSPSITFEQQSTATHSKTDLINEMVGDVQRIKRYPDLGYQIAQEIPDSVWSAYLELIERGYTQHLMREAC